MALVSVVLVASGERPAPVEASVDVAQTQSEPTLVRTAKRQKVAATLSVKSAFVVGGKSTLTVKTSGAPKRSKVTLQRKSGSKWKTIGTQTTRSNNAKVTFKVKLSGGANSVRAKLVTTKKVTKYSSSRTSYGVYKCKAGKAPATYAYYANTPQNAAKKSKSGWTPKSTNGDGIMKALTSAACAAKKGSTITIGTYIITLTDKSALGFFRALEYKARMEGVKVRFVLESTKDGVRPATVKSLRTWSKVTTCKSGCNSFAPRKGESKVAAVNHSKFVVISDTNWSRSVDPYVWVTSTNFSDRQLLKYWHNAVSVRGDKKLAASTIAEYNRMVACTSGASACSKKSPLKKTKGVHVYGHGKLALSKSKGASVSADYFPKATVEDPATTLFKGMKCKSGSVVQVASYLWSESRLIHIQDQLHRMAKEGCKIAFITSGGGIYESSSLTDKRLNALVKSVNSAGAKGNKGGNMKLVRRNLMHLKAVQAYNITFNNKPNRFVWYGGAQNFTRAGLNSNNENMLLIDATYNSKNAFQRDSKKHFDLVWKTNTGYK